MIPFARDVEPTIIRRYRKLKEKLSAEQLSEVEAAEADTDRELLDGGLTDEAMRRGQVARIMARYVETLIAGVN